MSSKPPDKTIVGDVLTFNGCNSRQGLDFDIERMALLSSDGAPVNSDSKSGLLRLFKENYLCISFI